jgi:hypothetical protein
VIRILYYKKLNTLSEQQASYNSNTLAQAAVLLTCIWQMAGLNLGWGFSGLLQSDPT